MRTQRHSSSAPFAFFASSGGKFLRQVRVTGDEAQQAQHAAGRSETALLPVTQGGDWCRDAFRERCLRQSRRLSGLAHKNLLGSRHAPRPRPRLVQRLTQIRQRLSRVGLDSLGDLVHVHVTPPFGCPWEACCPDPFLRIAPPAARPPRRSGSSRSRAPRRTCRCLRACSVPCGLHPPPESRRPRQHAQRCR